MSAANTAIVQMFDSTCTTKDFASWEGASQVVDDHEHNLH